MDHIELIVGGFVVAEDGRLLLIRGPKFHQRWVVPGGHVEVGEELEAALRREVMEEVGLAVQVGQFLGVRQAIDDREFFPGRHCVLLDFFCRRVDGEIRGSDEVAEWCWVSPEEALALPLGPYTRSAVTEYREQYSNLFGTGAKNS